MDQHWDIFFFEIQILNEIKVEPTEFDALSENRFSRRHPAVTYVAVEHQGHLFWITCKWLKLLRKSSRLQVI